MAKVTINTELRERVLDARSKNLPEARGHGNDVATLTTTVAEFVAGSFIALGSGSTVPHEGDN